MNRQRRAGPVVALAAVLGLAGAPTGMPAASAQDGGHTAQVRWRACPEDVAADSPRLQCATVPVPLDYGDPGGTQIEIMISRLASENPAARRGVLLLNPGGPGGSGLTQPVFLTSKGLPGSVRDSYDLIGMDTRGIGHSAPLSCGFTSDGRYQGNIPPYAVDDAAVTAQAAIAEQVAGQCAANDRQGLLRHVSTANMARDLDRIRAALGEKKASYLGYSYGASLGAAYASMFPGTTDRIVLDSNYGDTHLDRDGLRRYGQGMEQTFPDFARWAAERHDTYGLGRTPEDVRTTYFTLAERLDKTPAGAMNGGVFRLNTFVGLYNPGSYDRMAQAWQSLLGSGPPTDTPPTAAGPSPNDNMWSVFLAVTCNDVQWPEDVETYRRAVAEDREKYPLFGAAAADILPCAFWPHEPVEPPAEVVGRGPANVLIVQNRRDPVTPLRGGELLDEKFGERSRLLRVDGSGHGVYVIGGNHCAADVVTSYLVDATMPERDVDCAADKTHG
ncbi:alpha/beta hydrolase [Nocardia sp. NPDC052254]|uniref:alpha/beta hydrolase n=1 Tax=Nocardia sp. NPDC052254 TaxID=3155681 RepID=UPI00341A3A0F